MAQIDLRHAEIYFIDGYSKAGVVDQTTPVPGDGDTTLGVSGFTSAIPIGATFMVVGSTTRYTITGVTGGATPTQLTFTPPFATADGIPANSAAVTVGPNVLKIDIGEGNLTFEEKRAINYVREKKSVSAGFVMTGDDEPMDVSLDFIWTFLSSDAGDPPTPQEALNKIGAAVGWVTAGSDPCEPYAIDIEVVYQPPCAGIKGERILLAEYRWESLSHDLKAGTMSTKGKCKVLNAIVTRETSPITP